MARVDDASATAARVILGLDDLSAPESGGETESGSETDRVHALLEAFFSLTQLTPRVPIPEELATRLNERLAATSGADSRQTTVRRRGLASGLARMASSRVHLPRTAMVMLVVALVLSVGANILLCRAGEFRPETAIHLAGTGSAPEARGVVLFDGARVVVHADGLAELASGYRYVAWNSSGIGSEHLGSLTMLSSNSGRLVTSVKELMPVVVITIEPSAAPASPAGPQILVGSSVGD